MKIITAPTNQPTPIRAWDWAAWVEGEEETLSARGPTEQAAIEALYELINERENAT